MGRLSITCGRYSQLWRRMKRKGVLPDAGQLLQSTCRHGMETSHHQPDHAANRLGKPGMQLDLGGIAKGFAADEALRVLQQQGITRAVVAASGDMAIGDAPPGEIGWPITLRTFEAADGKDRLITVRLTHCGVSTSGDLHQSIEITGKHYSHIVDPGTGLGLTARIACSVIAPNATLSDALATAMCVLGVQRGLETLPSFPAHEHDLQRSTAGAFTSWHPLIFRASRSFQRILFVLDRMLERWLSQPSVYKSADSCRRRNCVRRSLHFGSHHRGRPLGQGVSRLRSRQRNPCCA